MNVCRQCSNPKTLRSTAARHASRFGSSRLSALGAPALQKTTSTRPKRSNARSARLSTSSAFVTSTETPVTSASSTDNSSTVRCRRSGRRDASITFIPRSMNAAAVARPIPVEPPVITAVLPERSMRCGSRFGGAMRLEVAPPRRHAQPTPSTTPTQPRRHNPRPGALTRTPSGSSVVGLRTASVRCSSCSDEGPASAALVADLTKQRARRCVGGPGVALGGPNSSCATGSCSRAHT